MRYIDVCSGISAPTTAWKPLGWQPLCFAEIEAAPRAVLSHHYPEVPLRGDFTQIRGDEYGPVDLLVGGTPCQDFSVAGLRAGLDGERGNLTLEYLRLADRARPRWLVWENVPGVLSIDGGRAFGAILGGLAKLGYGFAYRVLDAQHFGVPQRRRRVFVVGHLGDWRRAAAVLFERHSLSGNPPPRREKGEGIARPITPGSPNGSGYRNDADTADNLIAYQATGDAFWRGGIGPLSASDDNGSNQLIAHSLRAVSENPGAGPDGAGFRQDGVAYTLEARSVPQAVAFNITPSNSNKDFNARQSERAQALTAGGNRPSARGGDLIAAYRSSGNCGAWDTGDRTDALTSANDMAAQHLIQTSAVRRLTPRECERLQGFPDDFTLVPVGGRGKEISQELREFFVRTGQLPRPDEPKEEYAKFFSDDYLAHYEKIIAEAARTKLTADGPRYKMLGNSMAVPVVRWIGERIAAVEALSERQVAA